MLVQSCLDAFLATMWKLRTAPAPLPESCSAATFRLGPQAARPQRPYCLVVRLCPSAHVPHDPRVVSSSGPTCPSSFNKYNARRAYPSFYYLSAQLYLYIIVAMFAVIFVLLGHFMSAGSLT